MIFLYHKNGLRPPLHLGLILLFPFFFQQQSSRPVLQTYEPGLDRFVLPEVQFNQTELPQAIEFLREETYKLDPGKKGVNIIYKPDRSSPDSTSHPPRLTLYLKNTPLPDVIEQIAELTGTKIHYNSNTILLYHESDSKFLQASMNKMPRGAVAEKLKTWHIPHLSFNNVSILDAINFISVHTMRLDPSNQGISFVFEDERPANETVSIDMRLYDVPILDCLRYSAWLADYEFLVTDDAVNLRPAPKKRLSLLRNHNRRNLSTLKLP